MNDAIVIILCCAGLFSSLTGTVGLLRMPDVYSRIQCSSKTITLGALPVLAAVVVHEGPVSVYGSRALLIAVLTARRQSGRVARTGPGGLQD